MDTKDGLKYFASIVKEIGITGFVVITITFIFLFWGTSSQKQEFIDLYILFKNTSPVPCVLIIVSLGLLMVIGTIYYQKMLKLKKKENNRIGVEKSKWQELALGKALESSK